MFNYQEFDATAYGVISADTASTDNLYKPYIQTTQYNTTSSLPTLCGGPLTFTPPGSGTTNYLLQATFLTTDTDSLSRPYFNPANPAAPIYNTEPQTRWDTIFYSLKSAVSPAIPTPDAGYVGLYVIAVASGATQILNSNISVYSGAPFITESLTQKVSYNSLQQSKPIYALDTGTANNYVVSPTPAYTALQAGTRIFMKAANTNTATSVLNVSGLGNVGIQVNSLSGVQQLVGNEIISGQLYEFIYDGTKFTLLNPTELGSEFVGASAYSSGTVSLPVATVPTKIAFDTSEFDTNGFFTSGTNRMTALYAGYYRISSMLAANTTSNASRDHSYYIQIYKNGSLFKTINEMTQTSLGDTVAGSQVVKAAANDYFEIWGVNGDPTNALTVPSNAPGYTNQQTSSFQFEYLGNHP
jgi:hypothetical protein